MLANNDRKRTLASFWDTLNKGGKVDVEQLKSNIDTAVGKFVQVMGPMVEYQTVACKNDLELGGRPF